MPKNGFLDLASFFRLIAWSTLVCLGASTFVSAETGWRKQEIHDRFFTEGAASGDIDGDGIVDLVAGPLWFRGPEFTEKFQIAPPKDFPITVYSDNFISRVVDVTGDGAADVIVIGFPGKAARLYVNPGHGRSDQPWSMHEITGSVDNESPAIVDLIPGGAPEIVCGNETQYGYYAAGDDATKSWTWHPISRPGACPNRFTHGMGVGDIDGDGRLDVLGKSDWWRQPESLDSGDLWESNTWNRQANYPGGAQICVGDLDGDGDADIVTSLHAHGYGLAWFEQDGAGPFVRHDIMGESSQDNPFGVAFSQLHALALRDIDGDGIDDLVTGKRYMAHQGKDVGGLGEPVLYWFRGTRGEEGVEFVPHRIDDDSGVGTDVLVADLNADGHPDVVSSSKHGLTIHWQDPQADSMPPQRWQVSRGRDQSKYAAGFSPEEAAKNMLVPDGFHVDLIASEPELTQPIAMCFDAKGRIWVIEGHTYPQKAPEGEGKDRVVIFADNDGDGSFETKSTFIEGINLASGIEVGFGGVWIGAAPELLFIPDADHDGKPDGDPVVLLDGWGYQDTHETLNSFTWGADGWLYGCHGVFTHSNVGKPGTLDALRTKINAGVWRYHPIDHKFEVFAHGTSNPWGLDYNADGEWFVTSCVIPHLFHIQPGARYHRQAGRHFNPHTYDDIKTIADHAHFTGSIAEHAFWGENKVTRPAAGLDTSMLGGGHAHCGLAIYDGDVFPPEYRGDLFFHNLHGHRVVRETLERDGSGYVGRHRPDFALSQDHHQIGVGIMVGPDGAIYTSDWHDPQTCHNRSPEIWDRTNGRMFRIRYGDVRPVRIDLWAESDDALRKHAKGTNGFLARQATRILQERSGVLGDDAEIAGADDVSELARRAEQESDAAERRKLASYLQQIEPNSRWEIIQKLASHGIDAKDRNIPYLIWYALEPLVEIDPDRAFTIASGSAFSDLKRFVIRRTAATPEGREALAARLADESQRPHRLLILEELLAAAGDRGGVDMPASWPLARAALADAPLEPVRVLTRRVAVQFGDETVFPYFRQVLADATKPIDARRGALEALKTAGDPQLAEQLHGLLGDARLAGDAVTALSRFDDPATPQALLSRINDFDTRTRSAALATLAVRPTFADALLTAMEQGTVAATSVPAYIVRQMMTLGGEDDRKRRVSRLENVWGKVSQTNEQMKSAYQKYTAMLTPRAIAGADARLGRKLYEANCGQCHKLFGTGGDIGPDITGANRSDVKYWLENVLEPNALIGRDYRMTNFLMDDGRVIGGIVKNENEDAVTVQTATEQVIVSKDEIDERIESDVSLMPVGQLEPMSEKDVRSLLKYLMGPGQVALP